MPYPRVRSYVLRQGRMTRSQSRALDDLWASYGLKVDGTEVAIEQVFQRQASTVLEIGFGNGESLLTQAQSLPEHNFIGIEVHRPGVGRIIAEIERLGIKNLRIYQQDAVMVLSQSIPDSSLDKIQIFFPDPWPKKRHHKRRLIQPEFVTLLVRKLKKGGLLHCATDWENYAEQMMYVLSNLEEIENTEGEGIYYSDPYVLRPQTKFEKRGLNLKHSIRDLLFRRCC